MSTHNHALIQEAVADVVAHLSGTEAHTEASIRQIMQEFMATLTPLLRREMLQSLRDAEAAARAWGVTVRRAQAHIACLHDRYGVGVKLGGAWILTTWDIEHYPPGPSGRPPRRDKGTRDDSTSI